MMRILLQLGITDIGLLLRREEEKVLWPKTKQFFNNTINDLKARIKQELEKRKKEQEKQELKRRDKKCRKQQTQEARPCQFPVT